MKNVVWTICGLGAAAIGLLIWTPRRPQPLETLAQRLERAWADHHTVA